ncbi:TPA: hypothetical protein ACH3X2_000991 [Trebouxia sp. C0005]
MVIVTLHDLVRSAKLSNMCLVFLAEAMLWQRYDDAQRYEQIGAWTVRDPHDLIKLHSAPELCIAGRLDVDFCMGLIYIIFFVVQIQCCGQLLQFYASHFYTSWSMIWQDASTSLQTSIPRDMPR